jgi:hypothetical protein
MPRFREGVNAGLHKKVWGLRMSVHKVGDLVALQPPKGEPVVYVLAWDDVAKAFSLKPLSIEAAQTLAPQRLAEALGKAKLNA